VIIRTSALGLSHSHKPSSYRRFFERRLCDVKQPLSLLPGEGPRTAKSRRWRQEQSALRTENLKVASDEYRCKHREEEQAVQKYTDWQRRRGFARDRYRLYKVACNRKKKCGDNEIRVLTMFPEKLRSRITPKE